MLCLVACFLFSFLMPTFRPFRWMSVVLRGVLVWTHVKLLLTVSWIPGASLSRERCTARTGVPPLDTDPVPRPTCMHDSSNHGACACCVLLARLLYHTHARRGVRRTGTTIGNININSSMCVLIHIEMFFLPVDTYVRMEP